MSPSPKVLETIHRLLELSSSPNEYEAANAISKAQEYLTRYNLSLEDIELHGEFRDGIVHKRYWVDWLGSRQPFMWCVELAEAIGNNTFVKVIYYKRMRRITFIGREMDVDATIEMFDWLHKEIYRLAVEASHNQEGEYKVHAYRYRTSFLTGCVLRLSARFRDERYERERQNCKVTALVRKSNEENQKYIDKKWPKIGSGTGDYMRSSHYAAADKGSRVASNLSLSKPKSGVSSPIRKQLCAAND